MEDEYDLILGEISQLYIVYVSRVLQQNGIPVIPHLHYYHAWLLQQLTFIDSTVRDLESGTIFEKALNLVLRLHSTSAAGAAKALLKIMSGFPAVASGRLNESVLLLTDGSLNGVYEYALGVDHNLMFQAFVRRQTDLQIREDNYEAQILELGTVPSCGLPQVSKTSLNKMFLQSTEQFHNGYNYTFAASSQTLLRAAELRIQGLTCHHNDNHVRTRYIMLELGQHGTQHIPQDIIQQYDVVITNDKHIYAASSIHQSLNHIRALLRPNGILIIRNLASLFPRLWLECILRLLPSHWSNTATTRSIEEWGRELLLAGFHMDTSVNIRGILAHNRCRTAPRVCY